MVVPCVVGSVYLSAASSCSQPKWNCGSTRFSDSSHISLKGHLRRLEGLESHLFQPPNRVAKSLVGLLLYKIHVSSGNLNAGFFWSESHLVKTACIILFIV